MGYFSAFDRTARRAARHRRADDGVTLIEVMVAFVVLMVALIPLAYLFTTSIVQAGQSVNQQTALSIAEKWTEVLSNESPPVNGNGEVVVDTNAAPIGPGATTLSAGGALPLTTITVVSTSSFNPATSGSPQGLLVTTSTGPELVTYTGTTSTTFTGVSGWTGGNLTSGAAVTQSTATETRGATTYSLFAEYEWTTGQNTVGSTTTTSSGTLPTTTLNVTSTSTFASGPGSATIVTSTGIQTVTYTGTTSTSLTGVSGGTGNFSANAVVTQSDKPNLCASGTPQLLKLRVLVTWGPNGDVNNVQDSVVLNYPPAGIQTLGFIALQLSGDSTATDYQGNLWSTRVTAPPVTIQGPQNLTIYPDSNGCSFAQVLPGSYTVSVGNATSGYPPGTTYGNPSFVANAAGPVLGNVMSQPTTESQSGVTVAVGAVSRLSFPGYDQGSAVSLSYPTSSDVEDGVGCPGAGSITCLASGESGGGAVLTASTNGAWSNIALPGAVSRIASVACAGTTECLGVGFGGGRGVILDVSTGPSVTATTAPNSAAALTGVTSLSQIACPSATTCVAIGTTTAGAAVLTDTITAGTDSWLADTLPANVTGLTSLVCPPAGTGCMAIGTTATPAAGTPVVLSGGFGTTTVPPVWSADTGNGFTVTSVSALACASNTACLVTGVGKIGAGASGPIVINGSVAGGLGAAAASLTPDTFVNGTSVAALDGTYCPSAAVCLLTGIGNKGAGTVPLLMYAKSTPSAVFNNDTVPPVSGAAVTSLSQMVCPATTTCVLIGATATAPAILTGAITATGTTADTWTSDTVPTVSGLASLDQVNCPSTNSCVITAGGTSALGQPVAFLLYSAGGTSSWATAALPTANPALYLGDIDCTTSGVPTYCGAVGASATGAVELSFSSGTGPTWVDRTPTGLAAGTTSSGVPVEINNTALLPNPYANAVTAGAAANITQLPDLYPFNNGYGLFAGDCIGEVGAGGFNVVQAATVPGTPTTNAPNVTVPLGLISVQALHASGPQIGLPYSGATFQLVTIAGSGCSTDTYTLQTAGPDGLSRTEVPYGSYTLTVSGASASNVSVTVGGNVVTNPAADALPTSPIAVSVP